jgi:hypothetical protein
VHLLTKEAFELYLTHLKPSGILAIHVSNQYLDLAPVVAQLASANGLTARLVHNPVDEAHLYAQNDWVIMTREILRPEISASAKPIELRPNLRLWTDDYNNLLQVFRF